MTAFNPELHIVIDGKIYAREGFSQEQVTAISHINFADQELASMAQNLRTYQLGRDTMVKVLLEGLAEMESLGDYEEPAEA